jgi:LmbE family N-acetylglucosaminyl deacetylase
MEPTFYPRHVLAIHAHPDDVEILAAGTLMRLIELGHRVTIVTMTAGDCGTAEYGPEEIAEIRREEARSAALMIGAEYLCAEFKDLAIFSDDPSRRRVTELLRRVQPDIVITASPVDYHCDHEATSLLVRDGCFGAPAPNYMTGGDAPLLRAIPHLYFCDPDEGRDREGNPVTPHFVVDVAGYMERKAEMLGRHVSQRNWLKKHHGMDNYIETMDHWTRCRGRLAKLDYGEGFRQYMCHPYPTTPVLQDMLGHSAVHTVTARALVD